MQHGLLPLLGVLIACTGNETKVNQLTPDLAVSVESLDFGEHKVDETLSQSIQLINAELKIRLQHIGYRVVTLPAIGAHFCPALQRGEFRQCLRRPQRWRCHDGHLGSDK